MSGDAPFGYEVVAESKLAVEVEGSDVHLRIRSNDELLADVRLSANQAVYFASQLVGAANDAQHFKASTPTREEQ